jgi:hypothetical protein
MTIAPQVNDKDPGHQLTEKKSGYKRPLGKSLGFRKNRVH